MKHFGNKHLCRPPRRSLNLFQTFFIVLLAALIPACLSACGFLPFDGASGIREGVEVVYNPRGIGYIPTAEQMETARAIIEARLDRQNYTDRVVTVEKNHIIARFPWKFTEEEFDLDRFIKDLGNIAYLSFQDTDGNIVMEGSDVDSAEALQDTNKGFSNYVVQLTLKPEGRAKFAEATARLVGQIIYIYMDDELIAYPTVHTAIDSDTCAITGMDSIESARTLASQINSGALPFALEPAEVSRLG